MAVLFSTLLVIFTFFSLSQSSTEFKTWVKANNKKYNSLEEEKERENVYNANIKLIEKLNKDYMSRNVSFEANQFADMTPDEFKEKILMPSRMVPAVLDQRYVVSYSMPVDVPDSFDWRDKGVVTSVKDQGTAGTCWSFSTVANIEGQWALHGNKLISLSAEQLIDCDDTYDPSSLHMDCGVFGGWPYLAYQYIQKQGGIESESDYPYCSGMGTCYPCVPSGWNKTRCGPPPLYCNNTFSCSHRLDQNKFVEGLKIKSWIAIEKDENQMQAALLKQGPLSVLINAELLQFYHWGVWDPILKCNPQELDHAILLVGYGTDKGIFGEKPYWLIKNSWGSKWGEGGYFKLIRGKGKCGIDQQVTSAILQ
jgi:cathepsin F